jgi:hypothetical protein
MRVAAMTGPLTYPPEITIESDIVLPPEFWQDGDNNGGVELALVLVEIIVELLP